MKTVFIPTKYEGEIKLPPQLLQQLPRKLVLALPLQFSDLIPAFQKQLEQAGKKVKLFQSRHGRVLGQILGCDLFQDHTEDFDAFLYIGDGKFHPTALLYNNSKPVYCYNPLTQTTEILEKDYLDKLKKQKQARLSRFLISKRIGLLVTTKPFQNQMLLAEKLQKKLERRGKEVFVFLADEINFPQLENFNFIESWINTACPRLAEDFSCLNVEDLQEMGF